MPKSWQISSKFVRIGDKFRIQAFKAEPPTPIGGLILLPEIFGVNENLKTLARYFACQGFRVIVPSLFDRIEPGIIVPYTEHERAKTLMRQCMINEVMEDLKSAIDTAKIGESTAAIGFCWGGTLAYLAACEHSLTAAVSFYGSGIKEHLSEAPKCPMQFHFGNADTMISQQDITAIAAANRDSEVYIYDGAQHAFANSHRGSFHARHAATALKRTNVFIQSHIRGSRGNTETP